MGGRTAPSAALRTDRSRIQTCNLSRVSRLWEALAVINYTIVNQNDPAYDNMHAGDGDTDMAAYVGAYNVARNELRRLDDAMKRMGHVYTTPAMRVRRVYLCRSIEALTQLTKDLPEF